MALLCKNCNESAFDAEEQVCKACGLVCDDIKFGIESNKDLSFKPFQATNSKKPRAEALNHGIDTLEYLSHLFSISSDVKTETLDLLKNIYDSRRKAGKSFKTKEDVCVLAGCCLLNVQRKHKLPVPANGFCASLQCDKKKVFKMTKVLQKYLIDHIPTEDIDGTQETKDTLDEEESSSDDKSLDSYVTTLLTHAPDDVKKELIEKTTAMGKLADSCWLLTGRSKLGLVAASAFLCFKSMRPKSKVTLAQFCKEYSLNVTKARLRVSELKNLLLKLGANIPSKTANYVNDKNILFHLPYILENSDSLRNDLLSAEFTADAINKKEFDTFRSQKQKPVKQVVSSSYADDMNASDIEISDSEIASYIRTDKQISLIQNLKSMQSDDSDN